jgi:hypothetical protein
VEKRLDTGDVLDIAALAHNFVDHPYWSRMSRMLANTEKAEMETLLDPTTPPEAQSLSRASVAMIRRLLAMPYTDIEQGKQAVNAVEQHRVRWGDTIIEAHDSAERN